MSEPKDAPRKRRGEDSDPERSPPRTTDGGLSGKWGSPYNVLKDAIRAVPSLKYALGVAGIVSVFAIVKAFGISNRVAVLGTVITFVLMVVLVVFAKLASANRREFTLPGRVLLWSSLLLMVAAAFLMFTCLFFKWPLDPRELFPEEGPPKSSQLHELQDIEPLLKSASVQLVEYDYKAAWDSTVAALELQPESEQARSAQCEIAMAWIRDLDPRWQGTFSNIVEPLVECLSLRAKSTTGSVAADIHAHIGWGYFMEWLQGNRELDIENQYRSALASDPENPYAHAMWGYWILWNRGPLSEALPHFAAAVKPDRAREFARGLQLEILKEKPGDADGAAEYIRALNDMRKHNEPLSKEARERAMSDAYAWNEKFVDERFASILPASEHLQTFVWLNELDEEHDSFAYRYWLARLSEANGDDSQAILLYSSLLRNSDSADPRIQNGFERCAKRIDALPVLLKALVNPMARTRAMAAHAIEVLRPEASTVTAPLLLALKDEDPGVRGKAAHALAAIGADPKLVLPALAGALGDPVQEVRKSAFDGVILMGDAAVPELIKALRDPEPKVCRNAARALGEIKPASTDAIAALSSALQDQHPDARAAAADALGSIGPSAKDAIPALIQAMHAKIEPGIQLSVVVALGNIGPDAQPAVAVLCEALSEALADEKDAAGFDAGVIAQALGNIGPGAKDAVDVLVRALQSDHMRIPNDAAEALGKIGISAKSAIPMLLEIMERTEKEYQDNQAGPLAMIAVAIKDSGDTNSIEALKQVRRAFRISEVKPERIADVEDAIDSLMAKEQAGK